MTEHLLEWLHVSALADSNVMLFNNCQETKCHFSTWNDYLCVFCPSVAYSLSWSKACWTRIWKHLWCPFLLLSIQCCLALYSCSNTDIYIKKEQHPEAYKRCVTCFILLSFCLSSIVFLYLPSCSRFVQFKLCALRAGHVLVCIN